MGRIIGIDLGTTNSCVACMEGGEAVIIPSENGERTTPSVVAFTKEGELLVGHAALRQAVTNAPRTVLSIKRDMGTDRRVLIDHKKYTPQEISAFILQKLKADAERYLGEPVTDAVITVPAYFSDAQRQATKDAGRIAGLSVQRIINEPTAAALAYGVDRSSPQKVMVYDLGGGTFDVSVLEINQEVIEVLATAGNNRLGGDDFDACLTTHIVDAFKKASKVDLTRDPMAMQRVRDAAEKAKKELSGQQSATVSLPYLSGDRHLELAITRETFDSLTRNLVEATIEPMRQAMRDAGLTPAELRSVLLVGGSTRIPAVREAVRKYTNFEASRSINPDECVALGAALQGGVMIGQVTGLLLLDVMPLSLGIETLGNVFSRIIDRNTTIPVKRSQVFTTAADFQSSVDIHVLQGERPIASANKTLGKFRLKGIKRAFRGVPQIEVTFAIDTNGIVSVSAKDTATGKHQEITITHSSNMSNREIEQAIRDAEMFAQEDARSRESAEIRNEAEQRYYQAKNTLKTLKGAQRESVKAAMDAVSKAQKGKDDEALKAATEALTEALSGAGASFEPGNSFEPGDSFGAGNPDDGAMDADFEKDSADEKDD